MATGKSKLTVLVDFSHQHEGDLSPTQYHKDETVFEEPETARYFCAASWCRDQAGEYPTGKPNMGEVRLEPHAVDHAATAQTL